MKIGITGGSGFIGRYVASELVSQDCELVLLSRHANRNHAEGAHGQHASFVDSDLSDQSVLETAFAGCDVVIHCAGINREIGGQTYEKVHVAGTRGVVSAARNSGVKKIVLMSFLRARPSCGSPYHESKWEAEEIVRRSGLDYTILKSGMVYGRGDHMLDHLSRSLHTLPFFAAVGLREQPIRPLAIEDLVRIACAASKDGRLARQTVAVTGAEELYLSEAARRVARVLRRRVCVFPMPLWFHYGLAQIFERTMKTPLVAKAQIRILSEGVTESATPCDQLPSDLAPFRRFTEEQIRSGLPDPGAFGLKDLRCCLRYGI